MKIRCGYIALIIECLFILASEGASAQLPDSSVIWIKVYGQPPAVAYMTFGNRVGNTVGLDTASSFPAEFREQEPPPSPEGFDAIWSRYRGGVPWGTFRGLLDRDFRAWSNIYQIDTFSIHFSQNDNPNADIAFKWPDCDYLMNRCDNLIMKYMDTVGVNLIDMFGQDSLVLPSPGLYGIATVKIYKYGNGCYGSDYCFRECSTGMNDPLNQIPESVALLPNYPNPFNPETIIPYSVSGRQYVGLKVYNVLGQENATLVNEVQEPGFKTVIWNAANVPSGVYFYRIQIGRFTETRKMIFMR